MRVLKKWCQVEDPRMMNNVTCKGFNIDVEAFTLCRQDPADIFIFSDILHCVEGNV